MEKIHWFERLKELVEACLFSGRRYPYQDPNMPEILRQVMEMVRDANGVELRPTQTILSYGHVGARLNLNTMGHVTLSIDVMVKPTALRRFEMELVELSKEMMVKTILSEDLKAVFNGPEYFSRSFFDVQVLVDRHNRKWKIPNTDFFYARNQIALGEICCGQKDFVAAYGDVILLQGDEVLA